MKRLESSHLVRRASEPRSPRSGCRVVGGADAGSWLVTWHRSFSSRGLEIKHGSGFPFLRSAFHVDLPPLPDPRPDDRLHHRALPHREFLADPSRIRFDDSPRIAYLSSIGA